MSFARLTFSKVPLFIILATVLVFIDAYTLKVTEIQEVAMLPFAVFIDISIGIPLLYYFLIIRKNILPSYTITPIFLTSFGITYLLILDVSVEYAHNMLIILPFIELVLLTFFIFKIKIFVKHYRIEKEQYFYASDTLHRVFEKLYGKIFGLNLLLSEALILYYAFFSWFKKYTHKDKSIKTFSYHKDNFYSFFVFAIIFAMIVEGFIVHLLLGLWSLPVAWTITGLSIYSAIWIVGDYKFMKLQPLVLTADTLYFRMGMRWKANIKLSSIQSISSVTSLRDDEKEKFLIMLSLGDPNMLLYFNKTLEFTGLFGIKKSSDKIAIFLDAPHSFSTSLQALMKNMA